MSRKYSGPTSGRDRKWKLVVGYGYVFRLAGRIFFSTILALITVSDIRDTAFTNPDYKILSFIRGADLAP